jgi:hypothetical protein
MRNLPVPGNDTKKLTFVLPGALRLWSDYLNSANFVEQVYGEQQAVLSGYQLLTLYVMADFAEHHAAPAATYWGKSDFGDCSAPPWTLVWRKESGYSAVSSQAFKAGDRILLEQPTTWTEAWHPFTEYDKQRIESEVSQLSPGKLLRVLSK